MPHPSPNHRLLTLRNHLGGEAGFSWLTMLSHLSHHRSPLRSRLHSRAYTLLEVMAAVTVFGVLLGIGVPSYRTIIERQHAQAAVADLATLGLRLQKYFTNYGRFPDSLADIGAADMRDPWGNAYRYLNFDADIPGIKGKIRKDHNLHPINSSFDLYSMGPDGDSKSPLTAKASRDDVLWARDGAFIGPASDF